jgi:hypothetical protein
MKPFALILLIGAIVALSDLLRQSEVGKRGGSRVPFIPAALRNIVLTRGRRWAP